MSRNTTWFLLVCCLAALLLARESRQPDGSLAGLDRAFFDWLATNAHLGAPNRREVPVTLVEIDDAMADTPGRLPLSTLEYGAFLRTLRRYDPAVVAVEPVLDFSHASSGTEQILLDQALGVSKLLLGVELGDSAGNGLDAASLPDMVQRVEGNIRSLTEYPEIVSAPNVRLLALTAASGAVNLPRAAAGPVREVPLLFRCRGRVLPSFTLQALTLALRLAPLEVQATPGVEVRLGDKVRVPVTRAGRALLDAREFGRFGRLSLDDLPLLDANQAPPQVRAVAERMRGGIVMLGRTDRAARTLHLANGRAVAPAEVFAWAMTSLQRLPPVRRASWWWDAGFAVALLLIGLAGRRRGLVPGTIIVLLTLVFYALMALSFFESLRLWLPLALPLGLSAMMTLLIWLLPEPGAT